MIEDDHDHNGQHIYTDADDDRQTHTVSSGGAAEKHFTDDAENQQGHKAYQGIRKPEEDLVSGIDEVLEGLSFGSDSSRTQTDNDRQEDDLHRIRIEE